MSDPITTIIEEIVEIARSIAEKGEKAKEDYVNRYDTGHGVAFASMLQLKAETSRFDLSLFHWRLMVDRLIDRLESSLDEESEIQHNLRQPHTIN
jgi:hypothetical protein